MFAGLGLTIVCVLPVALALSGTSYVASLTRTRARPRVCSTRTVALTPSVRARIRGGLGHGSQAVKRRMVAFVPTCRAGGRHGSEQRGGDEHRGD